MPVNLGPKEMQSEVRIGFKRMHNFRRARLMFLRAFTGQYYDADSGSIGNEPLNLIFNAVRIMVPNIVMSNPTFHVESNFIDYKDYAELLGKSLDLNSKQLKIRDIYRRWLVDSIFTLGTLKTGLMDSNTAITFDEDEELDPGMIYTENVDFDNLVIDPTNRGSLRDSGWIGDRIRIPRQHLLDSGEYNNDLIMQLPKVRSYGGADRGSDLSMRNVNQWEVDEYADEVEVVEVWIPKAQAIVTVPAPITSESMSMPTFNDWLREADYNGPDEGPYTFLSLTPPVPGNPMPVAPVGIWHDLHVMANRMVKKTLDQADRQKDLILYRRQAADDAQEMLDAGDGETLAVDDPEGIQAVSFGGQQNSNVEMVSYLQTWFNMAAANPQGIGGQALDSDSATEARILQQNSDVGLEDMRDIMYLQGAEEAGKRAFYMHTDPLINLPLSRRETQETESGTIMQEVQVFLTPEVRRGDFLDYTFKIQPESMDRVDRQTRLMRSMEFMIKVVPAALQVGVQFMQMGMPFNLMVYLERAAKDSGVEWMDEVWYDPTFQTKLAKFMEMGPQANASQGSPQPNGQPRTVRKVRSPEKQKRRDQQMGAAESQSQMPTNQRF